jgi:hypothetical protein
MNKNICCDRTFERKNIITDEIHCMSCKKIYLKKKYIKCNFCKYNNNVKKINIQKIDKNYYYICKLCGCITKSQLIDLDKVIEKIVYLKK